MPSLRPLLSVSFGLDARSLALLRMTAGILFLLVRLVNLPEVVRLFSDHGCLTRAQLWAAGGHYSESFSLFHSVGHPSGVLFLYGLALAAGVALVVGYRTRWATFLCWLFDMSLYHRNPYINPASDNELQLCLLWGFFTPWGKLWSWDARSVRPPATKEPYLSVATAAWRMQVMAIYMGAALIKNTHHWFDGTAVEISLKSDFWSSYLGNLVCEWALGFPGLLPQITEGVLWLEFFLPLLILAPLWQLQAVALLSLAAMHIVFGMCLNLETFSTVACGLMVGFLPAQAWSHLVWLERGLNQWYSCPRRLPRVLHLPTLAQTPFEAALASWGLACMIWGNVQAVGMSPLHLSERASQPLRQLHLRQGWGMFVPPPHRGGWYLFRGRTQEGRWVNLISWESQPWVGPVEHTNQAIPSSRYYLLFNARLQAPPAVAEQHARLAYNLRRLWEKSHPGALDRIDQVELYKFTREYLPGVGFGPPAQALAYRGAARDPY